MGNQFLSEVWKEVNHMKELSIAHNISKPEIWSTKFCHSGIVYHTNQDIKHFLEARKMKETRMECLSTICSRICKSIVCNVLKCRLCLDEDSMTYTVYRADPDAFCDNLLISPYMIADHMPQVYLHVLESVQEDFE